MSLAARPWASSYPAGLSPDAPIAAFAVHSIVERAAATFGDRTAIEYRGREISYPELARRIDETARAFAGLGVRPGDRVALLLPNTPYHPLAFFGALRAGAVVVHVSPLDAPRVVLHKLADSGARVLVTTDADGLAERAAAIVADSAVETVIVGEDAAWDRGLAVDEDRPSLPSMGRVAAKRPGGVNAPPPPRYARRLPHRGGGGYSPATHGEEAKTIPTRPRTVSWSAFLASALPSLPARATGLDDLALLQYTGGTTGMPKAAMLTHRNLSSAVSSYELWFEGFGLSQPGRERVLLYLPLFHIYGLTAVLLRCLHGGQTLLLRSRFDPLAALDEIEAGATALPGVPTMWIAICATPGFEARNLSSLRLAASGGAPMPVEVARRFTDKTGLELRGGWGMSETSPSGTNIPKGRPDKAGSIGIPLPGVDLRIVALDDPRRELAPGETGELAIRGANVTAGYLNRPEENAVAFVDGWFLTGDIGHMDADGFFFIVDRKKDMIISGGFNVYPQMIEQAIYEHPDVEEVLVIGVPDAYRGEAAKAFVKLRSAAAPLTLEALRAFLKGRVGPHEMPAALELRAALPRTPVGKLSKLELKQEEARRLTAAKAS